MKAYSPIVTALLLIAIAFNVYQCDKASDSQTSKYDANRAEQQISELRAREASHLSEAARIREKWAIDSLAARARENGLKTIISIQHRTIAQTRPEIAAQIDSLPQVETFVGLQDSVIQNLDSLLLAQENTCFEMAKAYSAQIGHLHNAIEAADSVSEGWRKVSESQFKVAKREKRGKKFWRGVALVCGGIAVFLTVQK